MLDILDKKMLENKFAEDFASPFYPLLADMYLVEGDLQRARKVCEIGLEHDSSNVDGKFIFAKVAMAEEKFTSAEKWLKKVVDENPAHFNALRMLIKLEFQLNRSPNTIQKYINRLLHYLPHDNKCTEWLNKININTTVAVKTKDSVPSNNQAYESKQDQPSLPAAPFIVEPSYEIVESMATFTMVQVLKSQQHYQQALAIINVLESRGLDSERIARERDEIHRLVSSSKK